MPEELSQFIRAHTTASGQKEVAMSCSQIAAACEECTADTERSNSVPTAICTDATGSLCPSSREGHAGAANAACTPSSAVICVDLASSGRLGLIPDALFFLAVLTEALVMVDRWVGQSSGGCYICHASP